MAPVVSRVRSDDSLIIRRTLEQLDVGVLTYDAGGRLIVANAPALRFLDALGAGDELPPPLAARLPSDGAAASELVLAGGVRYRVNVKRVAGPRGEALVTATVLEAPSASTALRELGLSARECQLVELVLAGLRNREIAARTGLTEGTVKQYLNRVFAALDVRSRAELIARVIGLDVGSSLDECAPSCATAVDRGPQQATENPDGSGA